MQSSTVSVVAFSANSMFPPVSPMSSVYNHDMTCSDAVLGGSASGSRLLGCPRSSSQSVSIPGIASVRQVSIQQPMKCNVQHTGILIIVAL